MNEPKIKLGIVGVGKIVRDQHLPSIEHVGAYELVATASRNASVDGVNAYSSIEEMLDAEPSLQAVALCMPPQYRYQAAHLALSRGLHVLLEKPPGATVTEVEQLKALADANNVSLYATWHSRHGAAVETTRSMLAEQEIQQVQLDWKEDVTKWHPNQDWIWQAGGLGVFDPGINGLSILTYILQQPIFVTKSELTFPSNKAAPIAASIEFDSASGVEVQAEMDWRQTGGEVWNIAVQTAEHKILLSDGGATLSVDNEVVNIAEDKDSGQFHEYIAIYRRFAEIIQQGKPDVDLAPLKLTADAFLLGDRKVVDAFHG